MKPASAALEISKAALRSEYDRAMTELEESIDYASSNGKMQCCIQLNSPTPEVVKHICSDMEKLGYTVSTSTVSDLVRVTVSWENPT